MTPVEIDTRAESTAPKASLVVAAAHQSDVPLFTKNDAQEFRARWEKIQNSFIDEPRNAVEQADDLVAGTIKRLAEVFATERQKLEGK
jgi:hypothetical protein